MINFRTDIRSDLTDIDNISNFLNYAVWKTINKHHSKLSDMQKHECAKKIIENVLRGNLKVITNDPFPITYETDRENGINGMRDIIKTIDSKLLFNSIIKANISSYAYRSSIDINYCDKITEYITQVVHDNMLDKQISTFINNPKYLEAIVGNYYDITFNDDYQLLSAVNLATYSNSYINETINQLYSNCEVYSQRTK